MEADTTTIKSNPTRPQGTSACQILRSILSLEQNDGNLTKFTGIHKAKAACDEGLMLHPADEIQSSDNLRGGLFNGPYVSAGNRYVSPEIYSLMRESHLKCLNVKNSKKCEQELNDLMVSLEGKITCK